MWHLVPICQCQLLFLCPSTMCVSLFSHFFYLMLYFLVLKLKRMFYLFISNINVFR